MNLGYARVFEEEQGSGAMRQRMLEAVQDDRFLFEDIRNKDYERKNYVFMRNMLRPGDVLYVDGLDSLGRTFADMAQEWQHLTKELQVDVVVLEDAMDLDSRRFKAMGATGEKLEQQLLHLLTYMADIQQRRSKENQREGIDAAKKAGKKFGRPALNWDWDLFDATAQRWADGEISLEEACDIMNSARSSWYKYVKERGFVRTRKRREHPSD